jgi:crotonobetainyl-CoA:carnitine CoA-transferase CaiB-like acyl-CoA transferase
MDEPFAIEHGLSLTREHAGFGLLTTIGPAPRLSRTPVTPGAPASPAGSDARAILEEHALGDRFQALVEAGVVRVPGLQSA